jgi:hypothetical protein
MRSQIILALLATAVSAAPVITRGDVQVRPLSSPLAPADSVVLTHPLQNAQLSKRDAKPGGVGGVGLLDNVDASVRLAILSVVSYDFTDSFEQGESLMRREAVPGGVGGVGLLHNGDAAVSLAVLSVGWMTVLTLWTGRVSCEARGCARWRRRR